MRDTALIIHFIGLAMGLGTSFAFMFLGIAASKMEKADAQKFMGQISVLSRMGQIGLALLLITGFYLITPYWSTLGEMPYLIVKLLLVLLLIVIVSMVSITMKKAAATKEAKYFKRLPLMGRFGLITTLTIVIMAVLSFH